MSYEMRACRRETDLMAPRSTSTPRLGSSEPVGEDGPLVRAFEGEVRVLAEARPSAAAGERRLDEVVAPDLEAADEGAFALDEEATFDGPFGGEVDAVIEA